MGKLEGKKVFITGAEQGIGYHTAKCLIEAGCDIYIHYFSGTEGPEKLVELATSLGRRAAFGPADLTNKDQADACVAKGVEFLGGMDILVNNVGGIIARKWLGEIEREYWQTVIDVNLTTMMHVTQAALAHLKQAPDGASIVNLASLAGRSGGHSGSLSYSMTKGAVLTWTRSLAAELGEFGIRVNAVAPGLILGTGSTISTPRRNRQTRRSRASRWAGPAHRKTWRAPSPSSPPSMTGSSRVPPSTSMAASTACSQGPVGPRALASPPRRPHDQV